MGQRGPVTRLERDGGVSGSLGSSASVRGLFWGARGGGHGQLSRTRPTAPAWALPPPCRARAVAPGTEAAQTCARERGSGWAAVAAAAAGGRRERPSQALCFRTRGRLVGHPVPRGLNPSGWKKGKYADAKRLDGPPGPPHPPALGRAGPAGVPARPPPSAPAAGNVRGERPLHCEL